MNLSSNEMSDPKSVREGGRVASARDVVVDTFSVLNASSRCSSSAVTVPQAFVELLGPSTPAKNEIVAFCHATPVLYYLL
jgi:hypothetical protein